MGGFQRTPHTKELNGHKRTWNEIKGKDMESRAKKI